MAFVKRSGLAGSAAGVIVAAMFFRGLAPGPAPHTEPGSRTERPPAVQSNESQQSKTSKKKWPEEGPWKASRQHFAGLQDEGKCPSLKAMPETRNVAALGDVTLALQQANRASDLKNERSSIWCIPDGAPVQAMIAIVPDPAHSHLSLVFDRTVEALQLSAESMSYVVDRYWLPWQPEAPGSKQEPQDSSEKEKQPGLLLFRWNGAASAPNPKVLYVFLVSDTSTAGINGTQFRNAVEYLQQVCSYSGTPPVGCAKNNPIGIMGPTFSGSLASLRALTAAWPQLYFFAYSGTVSSICAIQDQGLFDQPSLVEGLSPACVQDIKGEAKEQFPSPAGEPALGPASISSSPPNLTFRSLAGDSEGALRKFLATLQENKDIQCGDSPQVAILSEAATTYGGAAITAGRKTASQDDCLYTRFRYPREISSLRNASASSESSVSASPQAGAAQGPTYLPFTLADRQPNSSDEPPDFSRAQGPLSKEAVLMKYAAELRRGHYKYVGILGTNVVDVLFLAKFLRSACPDVRLFIFDSDLLFERDLDNAPYIGTLTVSTYPLVSSNLDWINHQQPLPRRPFADPYEEGEYNASLLVMQAVVPLGNPLPLIEVDQPFGVAPAYFDAQSRILPVWITVVGTGGYWPVQIIPPQPKPIRGGALTAAGTAPTADAAKSPAPASKTHPSLASQDFPPSWRTLALLLTGLALLLCWILWTVRPLKSLFHDLSLINAAPAQRFFFINAASASLAFALALLNTPAWKFGMGDGGYVAWIAAFGIAAIIALLVTCMYLARLLELIRRDYVLDPTRPDYVPDPIRPEKNRPQANRGYYWSMFFSATAWVASGFGACWWWQLHEDGDTHYGFFFGYRGVNLATGVSPLTPMLLLLSAIFLWSVFEILRLRFDDQIRPRLNTKDYFPGEITESPVADAVNKYFLHPNYLATFLLIFGAWLFSLHPERPFELFEKCGFGVLYELIFCLVVALMMTSGLRLAQTWAKLQDLLRELERSPMRDAFSRLQGGSWSPIWQSGGQQVEWTSMVRSIEVMLQIKNCDKPENVELADDIEGALEKRNAIRDIVRPGRAEGPANLEYPFAKAKRILRTAFPRIRDQVKDKLNGSAVRGLRHLEGLLTDLQQLLSQVLNDVTTLLQREWNTPHTAATESHELSKPELLSKVLDDIRRLLQDRRPESGEIHELKKEDKPEASDGSKESKGPDKLRRMEEFVALRYVAFIRGVLGHIRRWLILQAAVFSLVLLSLNVYSFEPHRSLIWSFTAIFAVIGAVAIQVLMQAHRDPVISRITGTQPNELGWQFFARIGTLGAVPLFTLLATHFPSIGRALLSIFQPSMDALK